VAEQYAGSIHGVLRASGDREVATCADCHGRTHSVLSHLDPRAHTSRDSLAATCATCHADRELATRRKITIPAAVALYQNSVHGRSPNPKAATCNDCHESHALKKAVDPASSIHQANIPTTCGKCHAQEAADYRASVHGTALARGVTASPTCTGCHGEHLIRGPKDLGSPVAASGVSATCAHCHEAIGIRETFGLPAGRLSTYQDSFHGLAARGGSPVAANCASCHGYHKVLPSTDPASATHQKNLGATCGRCHPGAGERFARGAVHVAMERPDQPILGIVRDLYLWLIAFTIGGMVLHNLLDFRHKMRHRLRVHLGVVTQAAAHAEDVVAEGGRWFVRMTLSERLQHAALAISFIVLVYTGFALKFPETWLFAWLARLEGGYSWRSWIHRGAAVVMVAASLYHVGYLFSARGREFLRDMLPKPKDPIQVLQNFAYWLGLRREPPAFERFGYIEKAEYWALIWGTVVMTVTGFLLWFTNQSLQVMDKWVLDLTTIIHYYEAWLAFLAIVVWHIYQNVVNPDVYPMNWAWLTGRIPEEQLRHEHRAEWEGIVAAEMMEEAEVEEENDRAVAPPDVAPAGEEPPTT
jgi:formate dehydrogenase gamma subunit